MANEVPLVDPPINIKVSGTAISGRELGDILSLTVDLTWSAPDRCDVVFRNPKDGAPVWAPGTPLEVELDSSLVFSGEVTSVASSVDYNGQRVSYGAYDHRHRLSRSMTPTTYQDSSYADIVGAVADRHGMTADVPRTFSSTKFPSLLVTSTDFELMQHISRSMGAQWSCSDKRIAFEDVSERSKPEATDIERKSLVEFQYRFSPFERPNKVTVKGWDPAKAEAINGEASWSSIKSRTELPKVISESSLYPTNEARTWSQMSADISHANALATGLANRLSDDEVTGHGIVRVSPMLKPGSRIAIDEFGDHLNGTFVLSSVRHVYGENFGTFQTEFRLGPTDATLADLVGPHSSSAHSAPPGVTVGIVTAITVDGAVNSTAAVKVKLPLIDEELETDWARIVSFGGGPDRGAVFIPEINDEVIVAFEHGDINRPYVLGSVWGKPGKEHNKIINDGKVDERRLISRLGNKIVFIDSDEKADAGFAIEVDDAKTRLFFGYEGTEIETTNRPLTLTNGKAKITLENDEITLEGNAITLKSATGEVLLDASKVTAKAKTDFAADGANVKVKASAMGNFESGGITTIKGSMVKVN